MATKAWNANSVTTVADLVAPGSGLKAQLASVFICNAGSSTAATVVTITDASGTVQATLAKPSILAGQTFTLGGVAVVNPNKLRVSADNAVSCYASGDES